MATPFAGTAPMSPQPMSIPSANTTRPLPVDTDMEQEAAETALRLAPPPIDRAKLTALGSKLAADFKNYENYRRNQEMKWARNLRQFLGEYDPDVTSKMDDSRSKAYPRITRVKCISMLSRLMNLLFPTSEKNWGIAASPVPNLEIDDLNQVLQQVQAKAQQSGQPTTSEMIEQAVYEFAVGRAGNLEKEIEDQLAEVGGNRNLNYVALCRKVLLSGIMYGAGVLKGPFTRPQTQRRWVQAPASVNQQTGQQIPTSWQAQVFEAFRPQFEFVPIWDYYPDMSAKHIAQMDGQFQRMVLSKSQLRELADRPEFMQEQIMKLLQDNPQGNYKERTFESELRVIGVHSNVNPNLGRKYEVIIWDGFIATDYLKACGIVLPQDLSSDMADGSIWTVDNTVIRADLSPWVELEPDQRVQMYHHFIFEEDDSTLLGNGLPNIMRDSQMSISAASRMLLDNASICCGPNLEVNMDRMVAGQDFQSVQAYKIWYTEGLGQEAQFPAVKNVDINSHMTELQAIVKMFMEFADTETFVNPATGGDMQKGPSEPFRTAAGASMIQGMAALPFKDVVRNFDVFTTSVVNALIVFNKHFNDKLDVQGDFTPIARGSSSLIAKEVRGMAYDNLAQTVQPEERPYLKWYGLLKERLAVRDIEVEKCMVTEAEAEQIDQAMQQQKADQAAQMKELLRAEVRKLLADATKSLTQADSNSAKGEVAVYNAVLSGLESGVAPADVHAARTGAGIPPAIAQGFRDTSGANPPPSRANGSGSH
jgi:hypothetical protein